MSCVLRMKERLSIMNRLELDPKIALTHISNFMGLADTNQILPVLKIAPLKAK